MKWIRNNFLTGILVIIPIAVAIWLIRIGVDFVKSIYGYLPFTTSSIPDERLNILLIFATSFGVIAVVALLGWVSKQYVGQKILDLFRGILKKVPIVGTIYSALEELLKIMGSGSESQFSGVVYVEWPRRDCWAIGFVTGPAKSRGNVLPDGMINVFVPTVPNPTAGFHFIVPESEVRESNLSVEEAFRTILSFGMAQVDTK